MNVLMEMSGEIEIRKMWVDKFIENHAQREREREDLSFDTQNKHNHAPFNFIERMKFLFSLQLAYKESCRIHHNFNFSNRKHFPEKIDSPEKEEIIIDLT